MRVLIRADGSSNIGLGHLVRCRTLARELAAKGAEVTFAARRMPEGQAAILADEGFNVVSLPGHANSGDRCDAEETLAAISYSCFDWGIVDNYALGRDWEVAASQFCRRLLAIDDFGERPHTCDFLLDQNYRSTKDRNVVMLERDARILLGPKYALIDRSYSKVTPRVRSVPRRTLLFFGGADAANLTSLALEAFSKTRLEKIQLDIVVGAANVHAESIAAKARWRGNATLHALQASLARLMDQADFAVGAGGSTNWERLYCGLPSMVASVAPNQVPVSEALAADGLIDYLGTHEGLTAELMAQRTMDLLADPERMAFMSQEGMVVVDGYGALRVAEIMAPTSTSEIQLRRAESRDCMIYFNWANETATRRNSLSSNRIEWPVHKAWFDAKSNTPTTLLYVLETSFGLPIGQIRFDLIDADEYKLSFSLDEIVRGRRLGAPLVALGMQEMKGFGARCIVAEVRIENEPSARVFRRLGFEHVERRNAVDRFRAVLN